MAGDTFAQPPMDTAQFTAWLDATLGRPLTVVALLRADSVGAEPLAGWQAQLAAYPTVRLLVEVAGDIPLALARIAQHDPDALLVCADLADASDANAWLAATLDAAEGLNLFERMLLALFGAGVTRASARAHGFEEGFAPEQSVASALVILVREAFARETYRRKGSSPPCYL